MKQLTCEMCGSTDLMKQDGVFVCQTCGTKYSVEEAKKMMIEGTVEVTGTVKVDDSSKIENYYKIAESAYSASNYSEAELYCNKILEIDSENSDALYLKGVVAAWQSTIAKPRIEEFETCFSNAVNYENDPEKLWNLAKKGYVEYHSLKLAMLDLKLNHMVSFPTEDDCMQIAEYCKSIIFAPVKMQLIYGNKFNQWKIGKPEYENQTPRSISEHVECEDLYLVAKEKIYEAALKIWNEVIDEYNGEQHPTVYEFDRVIDKGVIAIVLMELAVPKDITAIDTMTESGKKLVIKASKDLIIMYTSLTNLKAYEVDFSGGFEHYKVVKSPNVYAKQTYVEHIRKYHAMINKCDPTHVIPDIPTPKAGGCYVATCVYGSYDCPEVWTLRRYRDYTLDTTWYGRAFIKTYYAISPTIVKWFGETEWFKKLWKGKLDKMVAKLQEQGYESTRYNDKY